MSEYLGNFVFHPVGHGLFYSGVIRNLVGKNQFTFVYDCGGYKKDFVTSAINDLPETIDLLIISHFHEDHINGVSDLKEKHEIKTVVLPYLDDESKLLYVAALPENENKAALTKFILEPEKFLGNGTKVYFVSNDIEENDNPEFEVGDESETQEGKFILSWTKCKTKNNDETLIGGTITSKNYKHPIWAFHFFMPKRNEKEFEKTRQFFKEQGVISDDERNKVNWDILKEKWPLKKEMRESTVKLDSNISNLVCAHGPTDNVMVETIRNNKLLCFGRLGFCDCLHHCCSRHLCKGNIGFQFLTGDAEIDDRKAFLDKYFADLAKSILFQVPHHGSEKNWRDWFAECQPFCNIWPVTHNVNHRFKGRGNFPSAVFSDMAPYSVTEREETKFKIDMSFWV